MVNVSETDLQKRIRNLEQQVFSQDTPVVFTNTGGSDVAVLDDGTSVLNGTKAIDFRNSLGVVDNGDDTVTIDAASASGGYSSIVTKASDYTAGDGECVLGDASGGSVNIELPTPVEGMLVAVKKVDSSGNNVNINTPGTETIDGSGSVSISAQYASREITSDGTSYYIL